MVLFLLIPSLVDLYAVLMLYGTLIELLLLFLYNLVLNIVFCNSRPNTEYVACQNVGSILSVVSYLYYKMTRRTIYSHTIVDIGITESGEMHFLYALCFLKKKKGEVG